MTMDWNQRNWQKRKQKSFQKNLKKNSPIVSAVETVDGEWAAAAEAGVLAVLGKNC